MTDAGNNVIHSIFDRCFSSFHSLANSILLDMSSLSLVQSDLKVDVYDCMAINNKTWSQNP